MRLYQWDKVLMLVASQRCVSQFGKDILITTKKYLIQLFLFFLAEIRVAWMRLSQ
jgi:hypothetical protein